RNRTLKSKWQKISLFLLKKCSANPPPWIIFSQKLAVLRHEVGQVQRQFHRLLVIEAGIELTSIIADEVRLGDAAGAAEALGDIFAGQFDMCAAQMRAAF